MTGHLGDPGQEPEPAREPADPVDPHAPLDAHDPQAPLDPHDLGGRLPGLGPVESLLLPDIEVLPVPAGSFERIRRRAGRRRRVRTAASGGLVAAVVVGSVYLLGVPGPFGTPAPPVTATGGTLGPVATATATPAPADSGATGAPSSSPPDTPVPSPTPSESSATVPASASGGATGSGVQAGASSAPTAAGVGVPTPGPPGAAAAPTCATAQLTAALGGGDAGAGNLYRDLLLTNHGSASCVVTGFPGVSLLDAQGRQIGAAATFDHSFSYAPVVLAPGQTASDTIHTLNAGATSCTGTSTSLRIYPPDDKASLVVPGQVMLCGGLLSVSPFTAGSTGNPPS